jgi:hypothetical protein
VTGNIISLKPFIDLMDEEENHAAYFAEREELRQIEIEEERIWRREREIRGLTGEDDIPLDDGYIHYDPNDPDDIMEAFDRLIAQQRAEDIEATEALALIKTLLDRYMPQEDGGDATGLEIRDPHPDEPLTLVEATCLPELGGQLYRGTEKPGRPGSMPATTLRAEIQAGRLRRVPPFNKNWRVSRTTVQEWLELRHDDIDTKRAAASRAADTVHDIRKRQEATRSSLAAEKSQRSASAVEDARLRIKQAKDRLK